MKNTILFLFLIFLLTSCSKSVKFEPKKCNFTSEKDCKSKENCANVKLNTLFTDNQSNISDSINKNLLQLVKSNLFYEKSFDTVSNFKGLGKQFIYQFYQDKKKSEIEKFPSYKLNIFQMVGYQSEKLINLHIHFDKSTNENKKYFGVLSLIVEKEKGRSLPGYKLFKDKDLDNVKEIAEIAFREKFKIEFGDSYNKNGYFFKNNKFELPENIFLLKEHVLFLYNPYEIASLEKGNIAFQIPYREIAKYMSIR